MNPIKNPLAILIVSALASYCVNAQTVSTTAAVHPKVDPRIVAARIQADAAANAAARAAEQQDLAAQKQASVASEQRNLEYAKQINQQAAAQAAAQRKAIWDKEAAVLQEQRALAITEINNESAAPLLTGMKEKLARLQSLLETQNAKKDNSGLKQQIAAYTEVIHQKEGERQHELDKRIAAVEADYQNKVASLPDRVKNVLLQQKADQKKIASAKTIDWLKGKAADGDAGAQYSLGERFLNGDGVDQDRAKAREYLKAAADQGNEDAKTALKEFVAASN